MQIESEKDDFLYQGEFIISEADKKKYRRIVLDNGLQALLIHEPDDAENWPTIKRRKSTVEPLDAMVEASAIQSADEDEDDASSQSVAGSKRRRRRRGGNAADLNNVSCYQSNVGVEMTISDDADDAVGEEDEGDVAAPLDNDGQDENEDDADTGMSPVEIEIEAAAVRERGDRDVLAEARRTQRVRSAKLSAAAVCVGSGNAQDDPDLPGLAHCLEHMVFMGSAKYPDENGFDAFVQECGGSSNAWTDAEQTLFHFSVRQQSLIECLDRFAHLLGEPLLLESSLEREVQAVHSEFELACTNVDSQLNFFHAWLAGSGHPMGGFKSGNRATLWDAPRANGIDVRQRLVNYWRRHYTAGNMRLTVQSRISLDELEAAVRQSFACLHAGQPEPRNLTPPFANCDRFYCKVYKLLPAKDMDRLRLAWPGPPARLRDQPHRLLAICLTHEGPGSVLDCLRRAGLAAELWAGVRNRGLCDNPAASLFEVGVRLTPAGLRAWERTVRLIYAYIGMLGRRLSELAKIYAERRRILRTVFRFQEEDEPAESVEFACCNMHRLPPVMWLLGDRMVRRFNLEAIADYWCRLQPRNSCILITSRSFGPMCDRVTDGPAVRFTEHVLSEDTIVDWERCVHRPDAELLSACRLHLPLPNQFVSEHFTVLSPADAYRDMGLDCVPEYPIRLLVGDPAVDKFGPLYYYKDRKFNTPRAVVRVSLDSPVICESLENSTLVHLWLYMFNFQLNKELYAAIEANLWYEILHVEPFSIRIRIEGFNDKLFALYSTIVRKLKQFGEMLALMDPRLNFGLAKEEVRKVMVNSLLTPQRLSSEMRLYLLERDRYLRNDQLACLEGLTLAHVGHFHRQLLASLSVKAYVHGNYGPEDAKNYFRYIVSILEPDCQAANCQNTCAALPPGRHGVQVENLKSGDVNSALVEYFQFHFPPTLRDYVLSALLLHIMSEPCYDYLRTKHQLGYQVFCDDRQTNGAIGFMLQVSSQADQFSMAQLQARVDKFTGGHFLKLLTNLSEEAFSNYARSLVDLVLVEDVGMTQQADRYWCEILDNGPACPPAAFGRHYSQADMLLHSITKAEAVEFYRRALLSPGRRSFSFQIEGAAKKASGRGGRKVFDLPLHYCHDCDGGDQVGEASSAMSTGEHDDHIVWIDDLQKFKSGLHFNLARSIL